jgi:hypothetical protein
VDDGKVWLQFVPLGDASREEDLLRLLRADVVDRGLGEVGFEHAEVEKVDEKAGLGLIEWLTVALVAGRALRDLLHLAGEWARRAVHPVRVRIGQDELILHGATGDQQDAIIEAFFSRHRNG